MDNLKNSALAQLLSDRLGLRLGTHSLHSAQRCIDQEAQRLGVSANLLVQELRNVNGIQRHKSWPRLIQAITNDETYFFRDDGQMNLLRSDVLPQLIQRNRHQRRLRIWSAGSSHGEEIYSIAMLLQMVLPDAPEWQLELFGSDINPASLEQARRGQYREWSFRQVHPDWKARFFTKSADNWLLDAKVRERVSFHTFNLAAPVHTQAADWCGDMDLIICRNVLIYMQPERIPQILETFAKALTDNGVLITGHSELMGFSHPHLYPELHPGSLLYRKHKQAPAAPLVLAPLPKPPQNPVRHTARAPRQTTPTIRPPQVAPQPQANLAEQEVSTQHSVPDLTAATDQFRIGHYEAAYALVQSVADQHPAMRIPALQLATQCAINLGDFTCAKETVHKALNLAELSVDLHYLAAHVHEFAGEAELAIKHLEKCIYLHSDFIPAYIDLAALLEASPRHDRAKNLRRTALTLLQNLPPDADVAPYPDVRAGDLIPQVQDLINNDQKLDGRPLLKPLRK